MIIRMEFNSRIQMGPKGTTQHQFQASKLTASSLTYISYDEPTYHIDAIAPHEIPKLNMKLEDSKDCPFHSTTKINVRSNRQAFKGQCESESPPSPIW
jgi:hypothetical protein